MKNPIGYGLYLIPDGILTYIDYLPEYYAVSED